MHLKLFAIRQVLGPGLLVLALALTACGSSASTAATPPSGPAAATSDAAGAPDSPGASADLAGAGIDQTKLNVCALLPRADVETAIGALAAAPKPTIPLGDEVGCEYVADQARTYSVAVYNLDRWELFTRGMDGEPAAGVGDGGWMVEGFEGSHTLYVLLRGRAVVGVEVAGADTPQFRKLVDVALAALPLS